MTASAQPSIQRICVVGLFAKNVQMVERKTAHLKNVSIRFIDANPAHRPDPLPDNFDFVIFSKFTRHTRWAEARAKYPPDSIFFCDGGASMILRKIFSLTHSAAAIVSLPKVKTVKIKKTKIAEPTKIETVISTTKGNDMAKTRRVFTDDDRASAVRLAEQVTVPIAAEQLGIGESNLYNWVAKARANQPAYPDDNTPAKRAPSKSSERVYWTDEELTKIADEWVMQRMENPLEASSVLFEKAQRKAVPGDRQRSIVSVPACKPLMAAINKSWKNFITKEAPAPAPVEPEVKVVTLEVPRPLTAAEMLETMDEPALEALLCAKRLARESQFHQLIAALAANAGAQKVPDVKAFHPRLEIFDAGQKHNPRVAVVGLSSVQHDELMGEVKSASLPAVIRYAEGKDSLAVNRCDYAIICHKNGHAANRSDADRIIGSLGRERVILVETPTVPAVLQQVRNICSRK